MYERNFHWENLTVQLSQFAVFLDTSSISVTKLFESLVNFRKNKIQKLLLPEVTKLAKLLLSYLQPMLQVNGHFSVMKRIKTYLRSTRSGNQLTL